MSMPQATKSAMLKFAGTLRPSSSRAQCLAIANYNLNGQTIAERVASDHTKTSSALRAMTLMKEAGCAQEVIQREGFYGKFTFEDGSSFDG